MKPPGGPGEISEASWTGSPARWRGPVSLPVDETARDTIRQMCEKVSARPAHEGLVSSLRCSETWALVASGWDSSAPLVP